jgi:hypothetical protein
MKPRPRCWQPYLRPRSLEGARPSRLSTPGVRYNRRHLSGSGGVRGAKGSAIAGQCQSIAKLRAHVMEVLADVELGDGIRRGDARSR